MLKKAAIVGGLLACCIQNSNAIDLFSGLKVGFDINYSLIDFDDPNGDIKSTSELQPFNLVVALPDDKSSREWQINLGFNSFELDGSTSEVGQTAERFYFDLGYHFRLPLARSFTPWVGGGIGVSVNEYTDRFTLRNNGFLDDEFEDREETDSYVYLSAVNYWEMTDQLSLGVVGRAALPLGAGVGVQSLGLRVIYEL